MATIASSDILFATLIIRGTKSLTMRLSGISSYQELISAIRNNVARQVCGLATLQLRNHTQGWSRTRPVLLNAA